MSVLHGTGLEITTKYRFRSNRQWWSTLLASRSVLVVTDRSSWMSTASAVRYYTEIQSCLTAAVFPSILSGNSALLLLSLCSGDRSEIDSTLTLLVDRLYDSNSSCCDRISLSMSTRCSLTQFVVWSGQSIEPAPILLVLFFCCCCCWLSSLVTLSRSRRRPASIDR